MPPPLCRLLFALTLVVAVPAAAEPTALPVVAQVGPWPVVSRLVPYRGRLWFANSVKGVDHNSADLYSVDVTTGAVQYERHLWSQDAGHPVVHRGLLYWPSEDARIAGQGDFRVTNGRNWATGRVLTAQIFHVHALAEGDGRLIAATSAWRAGLQVSEDAGRTWRETYDHPTPPRRVSRITSLAPLDGALVGSLREPGGRRVVRYADAALTDLRGWPRRPTSNLVPYRGGLAGLVREAEGAALWHTDGRSSTRLHGPVAGWRAFALAADRAALWAVSGTASAGVVWYSPDGTTWTRRHTLAGGEPYEIAVLAGRPFVAGAGTDGRGVLWGALGAAPVAGSVPPLPDLSPVPDGGTVDWVARGAALDGLLADPEAYPRVGSRIRAAVYAAAVADPPDDFFARRLSAPMPAAPLKPYRDVVVAPRGDLGVFLVLWGMGVSGTGRVPPDLIAADWTTPENGAAKYFAPHLAAMWAAVELGQADTATIETLLARLEASGDPLWLRGDAVGALTALTGRRHGYDTAAWRAWWEGVRADWGG